jgi:hypothetical protein
MKKSVISFVLILFTASVCIAQQLKKPDLFAHKEDKKTSVLLCSPIAPNSVINNQCPFIKYSCPKGGIFCQMESAIHQHLNFWIKFRMGTDDRYSD